MNENYNIKSGIMDIVLNRKQSINYKVDKKKQEKCGHCNRILKDNERLRVNGKRICSDCKKLEVQKFLLYLERRKLNAKKE